MQWRQSGKDFTRASVQLQWSDQRSQHSWNKLTDWIWFFDNLSARSAFSFFVNQFGIWEIPFPVKFSTWRWTKDSKFSILNEQIVFIKKPLTVTTDNELNKTQSDISATSTTCWTTNLVLSDLLICQVVQFSRWRCSWDSTSVIFCSSPDFQ